MITTTRLEKSNNDLYYGNDNVNVALLEKEAPSTYAEFSSTKIEETEDFKQAKERMQRNLDKLLNYDRYSEVEKEEKQEMQEVTATTEALCDDDIKPTSTTMQFGEDDVNTMLNELRTSAEETEETSYKLNKRGKVAIALYSLCVAVVLALIVLNTGIIALLSSQKQAYADELNNLVTEFSEKMSQTDFAKSEENITKLAQELYNMYK